VLDFDAANAHVGARDAVDAGQRRENGTHAVLTTHPFDADSRDHARKLFEW